jgi:uridine phosphorylase
MVKQVAKDAVQYHIALSPDMIEGAEYVLIPGDPGRVPGLAKAFDPNAKHIATNREHNSWLANFHGQKILITSTGMGAPSTGIAIEELATIGLRYFLRVGTSGGIQPVLNLGDIVITTGGVRLEGTSSHYAPMEYPSVPDFDFTTDMRDGAIEAKVPFHMGLTASSDTFWPGQERHDNFSGYLLRGFRGSMAEWRALNVMNFEMEASAVFVMCSAFGLKAACICGVIAKRDQSEKVELDSKGVAEKNWLKVATHGIKKSLERRGLIEKK